MDEMHDAERDGQINDLRISGKLLTDVTRTTTSTGKEMLKSRLSAKKPGRTNETMWFDITVWCSDLPPERITEMLQFHATEEVVVKGQLSTREWNGKTYLGITTSRIDHGIE